ncbi:MAG: DUF1015 domain-containing protein [Candidatus Hydrogenedentes bacterium]|nr:DUF1015 domain-containing protein [Candidatus Hydrogenedentota bacterium]
MLEVRGFRGYRFNTDVVGTLDNAVTPPFDVITPAERARLAALSPYNMMHVLLPEPADGLDPYQNAARHLETWIDGGALVQDDEESFYLLEQVFQGLDGNEHARRAFFARVRVPEPEEDLILDHERTFDTKVADRMRLTEETQANLGAVFVLYADPDGALQPFLGQMDAREPDAVARTADGVTQRLWRVPADERVSAHFRSRKLYIADGHHRFRTAREYRDRMRAANPGAGEQPYDFVLMGLVAFDDPGLVVWPTHRLLDIPEAFDLDVVLAQLDPWFEIEPVRERLAERIDGSPGCAIGLAVHGRGQYLLTLRDVDRAEMLGADRTDAWRNLDVVVLHRGILERMFGLEEGVELVYEARFDTALAAVEAGEKGLAFFVKSTPTEQVVACADAHDPMPEKATYFFPKLPSGAVIHRLR